ncbi:hypothetical protein LAh8_141 [Aeromonas phage LAh_8]|uniref:Uncharacterized protein n=2 Tax=Lahexavirus TaxID=2843411 RepID=A0A514A0Q7_9CAUD|nr:hypothetical protein HWC29_gp038 [Aeromonas phage 4_4572]YP_009847480.1 hypothetical protein HWC31_gp142 [Aeromonas phage LAh_8]QDH46851.1 hypothetical protein LAh8_141 [Aeromonas phage LAh_8]QEG09148.1 hypothetical protein [Aeromonas phage 4_4572]
MITILIWALVILQLGCLIYALVKGKNPWEVLGGFSIWGVIPVLILDMISRSLASP